MEPNFVVVAGTAIGAGLRFYAWANCFVSTSEMRVISKKGLVLVVISGFLLLSLIYLWFPAKKPSVDIGLKQRGHIEKLLYKKNKDTLSSYHDVPYVLKESVSRWVKPSSQHGDHLLLFNRTRSVYISLTCNLFPAAVSWRMARVNAKAMRIKSTCHYHIYCSLKCGQIISTMHTLSPILTQGG